MHWDKFTPVTQDNLEIWVCVLNGLIFAVSLKEDTFIQLPDLISQAQFQ